VDFWLRDPGAAFPIEDAGLLMKTISSIGKKLNGVSAPKLAGRLSLTRTQNSGIKASSVITNLAPM
jgi:hypothetical protein